MTVYTTVDIRVYDCDGDAQIVVSEDGDGLAMVCVKSPQDYFGKVDFTMNCEVAVSLANAILKQVENITGRSEK